MDPFDDILSEPAVANARAGGKFQPKARARAAQPRKALSVSVPPTLSHGTQQSELVNSSSELAASKEAGDASNDLLAGVSQLDNNKISGLTDSFQSATADIRHEKVVMADSGVDSSSRIANVTGENADIFHGLNCLDDMLTHSTIGAVSNASKSHHELDMDARPERCKEVAFPYNDGRSDIDDTMLETEEEGAFSGLETLDIVSDATVVLRHNGKYQPKHKVRTGENSGDISHQDTVECGTPLPNSHSSPCGTEWMNESSIPTVPSGDGLDDSSLGFDDFVSRDTANCGLATNDAQANPAGTLNSDFAVSMDVHLEDDPKIVDEPEDEAHYNGVLAAETPRSSAVDEDDVVDHDDDYRVDSDDNDDDRVESGSQKNRTRRKSRKPVADKEKPIPKRRKANGAQDQSTQKLPKKFSHSTRRKKRRVDKSLLEMPEDEIDYQRLPIKDLILLADYKERLASKEAKTSKTPLTDQSTGNTFHEDGSFHEDDSNNEEENLASEQGEDYNDYRANYKIRSGPLTFNHQSYMNITPRTRWSKQDTELFYEAVRQFGTDFSIIQQLFPGRTRHQVKLKYKKEERQHPLRLSEAVTSRAKNHSHFQKVIEQLQKVAAEAEQDYNGDDSIGVTGEQAQDLPLETNEEAVKSKEDEDAAIVEQDTDVTAVQNPSKNDGSEDEFDFWSSYKSAY